MLREAFGHELTYDLEPLRDVPVELDLEFQTLPGLMRMSGTEHGLRTMRSREAIAAAGSDDLGLIVNLSGPLQVVQGGQEHVLGDGDAVLVSLSDEYSLVHRPPGGLLALRIPRRQFAPGVTGLDGLCYRRIPDGASALRFLLGYVKAAHDDQRIACPDLQHLFVKHVYDLIALVVGATGDGAEIARGGGLRAARLHAIKEDVAKHIDQPDLSLTALASRHGCTPRFVQRLFEADATTFTDYVLSQRLARAYDWLIDARRKEEKISTLAWDCGFGDVSNFNRAFRKRYGLAPSDVRARARR
jgi:AraC-like DNA-binding protein